MELSKLKHNQRYKNPFEIYYEKFERQPQILQLPPTFKPKIEYIFEILETSDIYMNPHHQMIEPIVNRNFGNTLQHQNEPNQHQHTNKNISKKHQHRSIRQHYQHRNISKQYQHRNTSQRYQQL